MTPPEGVKGYPGYQNDSTAKHIGMTYAVIKVEIFFCLIQLHFALIAAVYLPNSVGGVSIFKFEFPSLVHFSFTLGSAWLLFCLFETNQCCFLCFLKTDLTFVLNIL